MATFCASPAPIAVASPEPAELSPTTTRSVGCSTVAVPMSAERTA